MISLESQKNKNHPGPNLTPRMSRGIFCESSNVLHVLWIAAQAELWALFCSLCYFKLNNRSFGWVNTIWYDCRMIEAGVIDVTGDILFNIEITGTASCGYPWMWMGLVTYMISHGRHQLTSLTDVSSCEKLWLSEILRAEGTSLRWQSSQLHKSCCNQHLSGLDSYDF